MKNTQPIEKREPSYEGALQVHSIFKTIQGEGPFCGTPCVFVRLAGCNLQCPACDTDYTSFRNVMTPNEILHKIDALWHLSLNGWDGKGFTEGLVVITGGEPFRQHIGELVTLLVHFGYFVQVESNGTLNPPQLYWSDDISARSGAYLVISPKTGKLNPLAMREACALKYVVAEGDVHTDGLPLHALGHPSNPYPARPPKDWAGLVYVQPMDAKSIAQNHRNTAAAVKSCIEHGYILQLQVHKYIGVE